MAVAPAVGIKAKLPMLAMMRPETSFGPSAENVAPMAKPPLHAKAFEPVQTMLASKVPAAWALVATPKQVTAAITTAKDVIVRRKFMFQAPRLSRARPAVGANDPQDTLTSAPPLLSVSHWPA